MHVLLCYDISKDRNRTKLAKYLEKEGYVRLQKSVFVGKGKFKEHKKVFNKLKEWVNEDTDSLVLVPLLVHQLREAWHYSNGSKPHELIDLPDHIFI